MKLSKKDNEALIQWILANDEYWCVLGESYAENAKLAGVSYAVFRRLVFDARKRNPRMCWRGRETGRFSYSAVLEAKDWAPLIRFAKKWDRGPVCPFLLARLALRSGIRVVNYVVMGEAMRFLGQKMKPHADYLTPPRLN